LTFEPLEGNILLVRTTLRALSSPWIPREGHVPTKITRSHDFERRVFDAWINYEGFRGGNNSSDGGGAPYLNRLTGELSPGLGKPYWEEYCGGFDECWQALPGARKQIDLGTLPKLKKIKKTEESKPELKVAPAPALPAPIPQQPDAIHFTYVPPDAQRYLHGGRS
jgi:hypothetical protein